MNTELFAEAHQAKASHRINEDLRFLSCISCSKKKKETDLSDLSEVNRETVTAPAIR